jgi:hypothetical protein
VAAGWLLVETATGVWAASRLIGSGDVERDARGKDGQQVRAA